MGLPTKLVAPLCAFILMAGCGDNTEQTISTDLSAASATQLLTELNTSELQLSPSALTASGSKYNYGLWDNISEAGEQARQDLAINQFKQLNSFDTSNLDAQTKLDVALMKQQRQNAIDNFQWRHHDYIVNQLSGWHLTVPTLLITEHSIANVAEAEAYISRLGRVQTLFDQLIQQLRTRASLQVMPPTFIFKQAIERCQQIISGAPFDDGEDSALLSDFKSKVANLNITSQQKQLLIKQATAKLKSATYRAYRKLIAFLTAIANAADDRAGVWKLPQGDAYYQARLKHFTSTDLSAEDIHQLGLTEVQRLHQNMQTLGEQFVPSSNLTTLLELLRSDPRFNLPASPQQTALIETHHAQAKHLNQALIAALYLVVDTGIHHKRWQRKQAIEYFYANSALTRQEATAETDRLIVWPGHATVVGVKSLKIVALRAETAQQLGDKFDAAEFDELIRRHASLPLNLLDEQVRNWLIAPQR